MTDRSRRTYVLAAAVSFLTMAVYLPALRLDFVWDDFQYIVGNKHIHSLGPAFLRWAATDIAISYWHPLTWLSHALDVALWGLRPAGHHLTNILLHGLNTFLVVILVVRLVEALKETALRSGRMAGLDERGALIAGCATGVLFGIHPVHVESVAWVAERKDLLYSLFSLLCIMAYGSSARVPLKGGGRRGMFPDRGHLLSLSLFALALMSKPMAVTLPLVLVLLDWYPFGRIASWRDGIRSVGEKAPFIGLSLIVSLTTLWAQKLNGAMVSMEGMPLASRLLLAVRTPFWYLWKMAAPVDLSPLYPVPDDPSLLTMEYVSAIALMIAVTAACIVLAKRTGLFAALWGYYLLTLLPVLGIVRVGSVIVADRFTYLSSLAPFLLAGIGAARAWRWAMSGERRGPVPGREFLAAAAILLAVLLAFGTVRQIAIWKNDMVFWDSVIQRYPDSAVLAYNNRAMAFRERGETERALADLETAIRLNPRYAGPYINRAMIFLDDGQPARALDDLNRAIGANPEFPDAYYNRGLIMQRMGRSDLALGDFTRAIELDRRDAMSHVRRGVLYEEQGRYAEAIEDLTSAIRLNADPYDAYVYRGLAFKELGRYDKAMTDYAKAAELNPSGFEAYNNMGVIHKNRGDLAQAVDAYSRAIAGDPSSSLAYCNRGVAYGMMGRMEQALGDLARALELSPDMTRAYLERGDLYRKSGRAAQAAKDFRRACDLGSAEGCEAARGLPR